MNKKILWVAQILFLVLVFTHFGMTTIRGTSMKPTLNEGDLLLYTKKSVYDKGDIVIFQVTAMDRLLIKRIVYGPGEAHPDKVDTILKADEYYVLGDNASVSQDSRNPAIGTVRERQIRGRVLWRLWPLEKISRIGG
ncbi:MAG: hypothetical protein AVO33_03685 [delta proteobacterium ML8_F1]|nr:MAG: hypothetical protein AVO33_03685 [delta proteobacterium ML8_F1]